MNVRAADHPILLGRLDAHREQAGAAKLLAMLRPYYEAVVVLGPVANDPHGGGAASMAQDMLRRIKANR